MNTSTKGKQKEAPLVQQYSAKFILCTGYDTVEKEIKVSSINQEAAQTVAMRIGLAIWPDAKLLHLQSVDLAG